MIYQNLLIVLKTGLSTKTFTYNRGTFEIAHVGDRVIYINHNVENDNSSRAFYGNIGTWYEVLDVKKVEVGNVKFTNPYRYQIKIRDYICVFSAFQFMTESEWRNKQLEKLEL